MAETLLLVDDEEGIRTVLGLALADEGFDVVTAATGEEALAVFASRAPAIVLTDIKMPGMGGLELLRRLKAAAPEVEVIMLTGHGDMELAVESLKNDATDFITKPIGDDALAIALKRARERIAMRRALREHTENLERRVREQAAALLAAERALAARQVADGLSAGLRTLIAALGEEGGVFGELPCFIAITDSEGRLVAANQLHRERFGNRIGRPVRELYAGDGPTPADTALATGRGHRENAALVDGEGREIPVLVHTAPILDNDGEVELVLEVAVDVTEAGRLRDELKATRARFRQLFDEAPCFIAVVDRELRIVEANRLFKQGFAPAPDARCHQAYLGRETPCRECPALKTFDDSAPHHQETVVMTRDGQRRNVLVRTAPILDEAGGVGLVMEMSLDITELRRLQDRLSSLGMLIGSTAHGIKGLLTALDGGIYLLGAGLSQNRADWSAEGFADVKHLVGRIRKMVLDILYYAKKRELAWAKQSVAEFAAGVAAIAAPKAAARGIAFVADIPDDAGDFEADADAVSAGLVNILENAVDACAAAEDRGPGRITFAVRPRQDAVEFVVTDTGIGMDRETRNKLFTLFFSSKGSSGTGIGLFVCNQVVQQHGGLIEVASEEGVGSTFTVRLPRQLPPEVKVHQEETTMPRAEPTPEDAAAGAA